MMRANFDISESFAQYLCAQVLYHRELGKEVKSAAELFHLIMLPELAVGDKKRRSVQFGFIEELLGYSSHSVTQMYLEALKTGRVYGFLFCAQNKARLPEQK